MDSEEELLRSDLHQKRARVAAFLDENNLYAIWLSRRDNFAWYTGSINNIVTTPDSLGHVGLFVTRSVTYLITDNPWYSYLLKRQIRQLNIKLCLYGWYESDKVIRLLTRLSCGLPVGADTPLKGFRHTGDEFARLRFTLTLPEQYRYRRLCRDCTLILQSVVRSITPEQTGREIVAELVRQCLMADITPSVTVIGAGNRGSDYPIPMAASKPVERYAILAFLGSRHGLQVALTRMVAIEKLPAELDAAYRSAARIEAAYIHHTLPGHTLGTILRAGIDAYYAEGYADEWRLQPQGGIIANAPNEFCVTPSEKQVVAPYYAFRWAPKILGAGPEDTILVLPDRNEILTRTDDWPMLEFQIQNRIYYCPDILRL